MLRAQINTADALKYYGHGLPNKAIADALVHIREDINKGMNVHEAFRRTQRFSETIIGLIQAGSDAGQLHHAFQSLAARLKSELFFQKQIKKATITPGVIICVLVGAFIISQVKIVPQVEEMLSGVGAKPDAISFQVSHFTQKTWPIIVASVIGIAITITRSAHVRNLILGFAMSKWRLLRLLIMSLRQVTFISTIQLLHSNGINLAKSIRVSANSVRNTPFYEELRTAADKYEHSGVPLSTAFAKYTSVDAQVTHMLAIGEKSASLDAQLGMLSEMYEEDLQNHMDTFAAAISFIVLLIAVALIAAVFIGTFLPIFLMGPKMMQSGI
jgi:type II secretory pathway component PulF